METKYNDATPQRPEGDRPVNAPIVSIDLPSVIKQLKHESTWKDSDRNAITMFKSDGLRLVLIALHEGAKIDPHTAGGIISVQVIRGRVVFTAGTEWAELMENQIMVVHEGVAHSVNALEESVLLLTLGIGKAK